MHADRVPLNYLQYSPAGIESVQSNIAIESPVSLTVNGEVWLTFQCTPIDFEELAVGFLFNEGFISSLSEIENIHVCDQKDNIDIWLNHTIEKPAIWRRTSGCHGGNSSVDSVDNKFVKVESIATLSPEQIFELMDQFLNLQIPHSESGGVHTSALADGAVQLFQIIDIGRHNTFDKIAGRLFLDRLVVETPVLVTSGRISSDMVQKSIRLRAPFILSMRSASQLGINMADAWGITLIGGARRHRFNLLTHPDRIQTP